MKASVLIPTYESRNTFLTTLHGVLFQSVSDYEIFVLDNGELSKEDLFVLKRLQKEHKNLHLIKRVGAHFSKLYNQAAKQAKGKCLLFLASHCLVSRDWVETMAKRVRGKKAVAGTIANVPSDNVGSWLEGKYNAKFFPLLQKNNKGAFLDYHNAAIDGKFFVKRGFDEDLKWAVCVAEFGARLHSRGKQIPLLSETVLHVNQPVFSRYCRSAFDEGFDKTIIYAKRGSEFGLVYFPLPTFVKLLPFLRRARLLVSLGVRAMYGSFFALFHLARLLRWSALMDVSFRQAAKQAHRLGQLSALRWWT